MGQRMNTLRKHYNSIPEVARVRKEHADIYRMIRARDHALARRFYLRLEAGRKRLAAKMLNDLYGRAGRNRGSRNVQGGGLNALFSGGAEP